MGKESEQEKSENMWMTNKLMKRGQTLENANQNKILLATKDLKI